MTEPLPPELTKLEYYRPEKMLEYAFDIKQGKAGGEYFYSLEEDYIYVYEEGYWKKIKGEPGRQRNYTSCSTRCILYLPTMV